MLTDMLDTCTLLEVYWTLYCSSIGNMGTPMAHILEEYIAGQLEVAVCIGLAASHNLGSMELPPTSRASSSLPAFVWGMSLVWGTDLICSEDQCQGLCYRRDELLCPRLSLLIGFVPRLPSPTYSLYSLTDVCVVGAPFLTSTFHGPPTNLPVTPFTSFPSQPPDSQRAKEERGPHNPGEVTLQITTTLDKSYKFGLKGVSLKAVWINAPRNPM